MQPKMPKTPFAMSLSGSAKETELRIRNIFQWKKRRPPVIILLVAALVALLCGSLVGFTTAGPEETENTSSEEMEYASPEVLADEPRSDVQQSKSSADESAAAERVQQDSAYTDAALEVYRETLARMLQEVNETGQATLPDGVSKLGFWTGTDHLEENLFTVADVDGDGRVELLFRYLSTVSDSQTEYIFEYDETLVAVRQEFSAYPAVAAYYDNGLMAFRWGAENGSISLWPYGVTRSYGDLIASVSSWDKGVQPREYEYYEAQFPDSVDEDGDGVVYIVRTRSSAEELWNDVILDRAGYEQWYADFFAGAQEVVPDWKPFTAENIAALG